MRTPIRLVVSLLIIAASAAAESTPISLISEKGKFTDGTLLVSPNKEYFAVLADQYFGGPWDSYRISGDTVSYQRRGPTSPIELWLLAIENDGSELGYVQQEDVPSHTFHCSLQRRKSSGEVSSLLSFSWESDSNLSNSYACPQPSIKTSESGKHLVGFTPQIRSDFQLPGLDYTVVGATHYYIVDDVAAHPALDIPAEDFVAYGSSELGNSWINSRGDIVVTVQGATHTGVYFAQFGQAPRQIRIKNSFEVVGIDEDGAPLLRKARALFRLSSEGALEDHGTYSSGKKRKLFENEKEAKFETYDDFNSQPMVLVRGERNKLSDANCHLSNRNPLRIVGVLGELQEGQFLAKIQNGKQGESLGIVDAQALAAKPSYCPVTVSTRIKGGQECKSRVESTVYGQRIVASEYETLPASMRCGVKLTVSDEKGRRVHNFAVHLIGSRYSGGQTEATDLKALTNKNGQAVLWFDATSIGDYGQRYDTGPLFVAAPFADKKYRSRGRLVFYRYSHL
ncbi:MAG: hypothetical protein J0M12_14755 [Deltaproteobacteria bacterium]|nr:hypothetical protein [Deltaproteobacteria bacterium]